VARYVIAPERSHVWIDARSNLHPIHSTTDGLEGFVDLELEAGGGVDMTTAPSGRLSLAVERLTSGNRMEDRELQKRIDGRRYPTIDGVLGAMVRNGDGTSYRVSGDLTFHGVTRRLEDHMTVRRLDDQTISLDGSSRMDIRQFGMDPPRVLMLKVEPEVDIRVEIIAVRET